MKAITITSGKGGVGKSVVSSNLALALAKSGKRVLLFDADLSLANLDILLGLSCDYNLSHVLDGSKELEDILLEAPHGLKILPAASGVLKLERLDPSQLMRLAMALQNLSEDFDTLLIDTGAGLTEAVLFFNSSADNVIIVTTPDPTAMTDAYALLKILNTTHGVNEVVVMVNQAQSLKEGDDIFERLNRVCQKHLSLKLVSGGCLLKDTQIETAVRTRKPVILSTPDCASSITFTSLAQRYDKLFGDKTEGLNQEFWSQLLSRDFG